MRAPERFGEIGFVSQGRISSRATIIRQAQTSKKVHQLRSVRLTAPVLR